MASRYEKFVLPVEGGSVVVGRIKEVLVGEEDNIQRPTIGGHAATSCIATACTMLLWIAAAVVFLIIGIRYGDECDNLESNIPLYLIVQGILSLVYAVTCGFGCCFLANFRKISSWIVFTIAIINTVLTMLSLVWTVIGSIWIWNNWEDWDDNNKLCTDEIYITAMASVLVSCTFWLFIFCFAAFQVLWSYCDKNNIDI